MASRFIDAIGRESVYMSVEEAVEACRFNLHESRQQSGSPNVQHGAGDDAYIDDDRLSRCSTLSR